ncbi:hypothetical protein DH2020_008505 [Rehmannia glutinosa]|uniref:B box-type domain-containing protein n=1 Tax=Rehmannia glutinosa TaxID=99300 RepID=A0ABR0X6N1_REHGL
MKIQCNVCEAAEATVLCCADEAALCWDCDRKVHGQQARQYIMSHLPHVHMNQMHRQVYRRVNCIKYYHNLGFAKVTRHFHPLRGQSDTHAIGIEFHQEFRARFLLTGVKVALEDAEAHPSSSSGKTKTTAKISKPEARSLPKRTTPVSSTSQYSKSVIVQASECGDFSSLKPPFSGGSSTGNISQWQLDEFIGLGEFTQNYNFMDSGSPKADSGKVGDLNYSQILRAADGEFDGIECIGQVPETFWAVPQISSPPTASGLYWPKNCQNPSDSAVFVPDISLQNFDHHDQSHVTSSKRRRHF